MSKLTKAVDIDWLKSHTRPEFASDRCRYCRDFGCKEHPCDGVQDVEALLDELDKLRDVLDKIHSWLVCASISTPEDMAQSFVEMEKIAREVLPPEQEKG